MDWRKKLSVYEKKPAFLYNVCFEYLQKWTVSFHEFDYFRWMNLSDTLSFDNVQSTTEYLRDRDVIVDDVKCIYHFCNLKTFVESA
jgi:hypothetical protein